MAKNGIIKQAEICRVEVTPEKICGRGGLFFFLRYIENISVYPLLAKRFGFLKSSGKGLSLYQFTKQLFAHFVEGTDLSMTAFDRRQKDEAYAAVLENVPAEMASSHQMKRFFQKFLAVPNWLYRQILLAMFLWRLRIEQPKIIVLVGDSMVLDNDDAKKREGVGPTYKNKKGYHPLHITWGPYVVDAIFRNGTRHSNPGDDFIKAIGRLVNWIRRFYASDLPIIVVTDSAFLDDKNFRFFEERLKIHYICGGRKYDEHKNFLAASSQEVFQTLSDHKQFWKYAEFGNRLGTWKKFRRCVFTSLQSDETGQLKLEFVQTDRVIYTNLGQDPGLTAQLIAAGGAEYLSAPAIIQLDHQRGTSELVHRSLKEFATKEQLPFEWMGMNRAYYYFLVFSHFLYEAYKRDTGQEVVPLTCYPNTFRRVLIDFAVKIVKTGGRIILKVVQPVFEQLQIAQLWQRTADPIPIFST